MTSLLWLQIPTHPQNLILVLLTFWVMGVEREEEEDEEEEEEEEHEQFCTS